MVLSEATMDEVRRFRLQVSHVFLRVLGFGSGLELRRRPRACSEDIPGDDFTEFPMLVRA